MARYYVNRFGRFLSTDPLSGSATDPQTLNHYSYTRNDPINAADPTGMVTYPYFYGYGGFGGGGRMCQVDGLDTPCFMAGATVASGGGVECPNDDCGIGTSKPFQCLDSVCGYMSIQYTSTHEYEWSGILYSDDEWAQFISNRVETQRQALTDAIVATTGLDWITAYENLNYVGTKGGNANFSYSGNLIDLDFIPGYTTGGCEFTCRSGSFPSIHEHGLDANDDPILHLDTGNPMWGFGLGFLVHFAVDMLLGNINPSVPLSP